MNARIGLLLGSPNTVYVVNLEGRLKGSRHVVNVPLQEIDSQFKFR